MRVASAVFRSLPYHCYSPRILSTCQRSFCKSLAARKYSTETQQPALTDDFVRIAFSPENEASYKRDRDTLYSHENTSKLRDRLLGPLSASDVEIRESLQQRGSKPTEILRRAIKDSRVSHHVIRLCLETQYVRIAKLPRKARPSLLAEQREEGFGRLILSTCESNAESRSWTSLYISSEVADVLDSMDQRKVVDPARGLRCGCTISCELLRNTGITRGVGT